MALAPGTRLGPYEILALIGAGGMGEVYRARDTKLGRDVAVKVLPDAFARNPERLARFRREAHVLASLNHPHIASIYGLEESHGTAALVLELVEGTTLSDRLVHGPLPLEEAWSVAPQVAEALEAAHDHGIIHRDLKPANIKVRADGTVKVLDFGLAKALNPDATASGSSQLPTLTSPAATRVGLIMGTAAYMSPEQVRGRTVDKRADVWAFGCVLYEMLTGRRPFEGDDVSETMARVIEREPDWSLLSSVAPSSVVQVVRRCLQKDPGSRLHDIADARLELRDALTAGGEVCVTAPPTLFATRSIVLMISILAAGLLLGAIGARWLLPILAPGSARPESSTTGSPRLSTEINLPDDAPLALDSEAADIGYDSTLLDISPDGRTLVYVGSSHGTVRLYARQLDTFQVRPLAGTEGALHPFFSPDGRSVGFLTNDKVKTYSFTSGTANTICDVSVPVIGTWTADDQLFYGAEEGRRLFRVSAHTGAVPVLMADIREGYRYGHVTPDGKYVLATFRIGGIGADFAQIQLVNLATKEVRVLTSEGYDARLTPAGDLVFGRSGRVFVAKFDAARQVLGDAVPVASGVRMHALYPHLQVAVSATGVMVYVPGGDVAVAGIAWVDRQGRADFLPLEPRVYGMLDLSDDGRRLAVHVSDNKDYILIYDIEHHQSRRLPTDDSAGWPKWSPNGDALAYTSFAQGKPYRILVQSIDSDRPPRAVAQATTRVTTCTWSVDGHLTFYEFLPQRIGSVVVSDGLTSSSPPEYMSFPGTTHDITADGHWLVYADTGINVRPLPVGEGFQKIADIGSEPRWCRKCSELLYRQGNRWFSTEVRLAPRFEWKPPHQILQTQFNDSPGPSWALSPDGQRILVVKRQEEPPRTRLRVVHGWLADLK